MRRLSTGELPSYVKAHLLTLKKQPYNSTAVHCLRSLCVVAECTSSCGEVKDKSARISVIPAALVHTTDKKLYNSGIVVNTEKYWF